MTPGNETPISKSNIVMAKQGVVLKKEDDGWGVIFNPETDFSFAVNAVSAIIWESMKSEQSIENLTAIVKEKCVNVPGDVEKEVVGFVKNLLDKELAVLIK